MRSRDYVISRFTNPNNTPQQTPRTSAGRRNLPTLADWERDAVSPDPSKTLAGSARSYAEPDRTLPVTSDAVEPTKLS